jgi:hypothetical protein
MRLSRIASSICVLAIAFGLVATTSAQAQSGLEPTKGRLDLPAMTLVPSDLPQGGFGNYSASWSDAAAEATRFATYTGGGEAEIRAALEDAG